MPLEKDRDIWDVAEHTEHVTFQKSSRKTKTGFALPMLLHERLAFSPEEYIRRYDLVQKAMDAQGLDALLDRVLRHLLHGPLSHLRGLSPAEQDRLLQTWMSGNRRDQLGSPDG